MDEKVSIIMPAYNAAATIGTSIGSVFAQTYTNWELLIIDDVSTDETLAIATGFASQDFRIRVLRHEKNQGAAAARNSGMRQATGTWLAFLDSDDMWAPEKLEKQLALSLKTSAVVTYTATAYINVSGRLSAYVLPAEPILDYATLLRRNIMSCSSVMVRRDIMKEFPLKKNIHEDYVVWLQLLKTNNAHGLNEALLTYRLVEGSKSAKRVSSAVMTYNAYREVGFNPTAALLLTVRYAIHSITKRIKIKKDT